ncbi:MAG: dihydrolipoyl dehydrogenase family protein [Pseudonocardiaceae bacterium]
MDTDVIVIGAGAAGLAAATTARRAGRRVTLVSAGPPGGDCTFTGCVPSKTLLAAAARGLPFDAALQRVRTTVGRIAAAEDEQALRRDGIEVVRGHARLLGGTAVEADGHRVRARQVVLATGARPSVPPIPGLESVPYLTTDTVFELTAKPASLAILGAGPVGCELAQAFARLGVPVSLIEAADRILPGFEPEAAEILAEALRAAGVRLHTATSITDAEVEGDLVRLGLDGEPLRAHRLLVAVGRSPETTGLDLDAAGVRIDAGGFVVVDRHLAATAPGVYAAGDVTGLFGHTHAAYAMGRVAVVNGARRRRQLAFDPAAIPRVVFTDPEIAIVGTDEHAAAVDGARVAYLPMAEVDRAITAGRETGFVKLVAGPRRLIGHTGGGRVLGATIVAQRAGEMIHEPVLAMQTGMFAGRLAQAVHAYPTWSIAVQQAAAQFVGTYGGRTARPVCAPDQD